MKSVLITSSILIAIIAALRPILRGRFKPIAQYALWLIVAVRLLVPVELASSAHSALALLDRAEGPALLADAIGSTTVPVPAMSYDDAYQQALREYQQSKTVTTSSDDLEQVALRARELQAEAPTLAELAAKYARPVWLGGGLVMGLWFLLVNLRLRRKLRMAELITMSSGLPVFVSDVLPSPCLCGLFRPAIYVTPHAAQDPDRLRHVLAHETTHYRHRDHWWALVRCLCLCVYWFDPLVWWAAALSRQDCELACDAGAIRRLGEEERIPYGRTLVAMIAAGRNSLLQTATTMTGSKRRVRERVELIARRPKTAVVLVLAAALVLALTVGFTFTGAPEAPQEPTPTADTLQERLLDVPEELRADVAALQGGESTVVAPYAPSALAQYWMNRPYTDYQEGWGWLMTVYQWDQQQLEENDSDVTGTWTCFARDDHFYYVIARATDIRAPINEEMVAEIPGATQVETGYMDAFEAIRAYAMEQVLATEGVRPYAGPDTLRARLNNVPLELQADVVTGPGHDDSPTLVTYWMNRDWTNLDDSGLGFLLRVEQMSQAELDEYRATGGSEIFARSGDAYYAILYATDVRYYTPDDAEPFHNAFDAIRAYAMEQVLATEGVQPYTYAPSGGSDAPAPSPSAPPVEPPVEPTAELLRLDGLDAALFQGVYQAYFGQGYRTTFEEFPRVVLPNVAIYGTYEEDGVQYYVGNVLYHVHYYDDQTGTFEDNVGAVHVPCRIGLRDSGGAYEVTDAMIPPDGAGYYPAVQEIIGPLEELSQAYESGIFVGLDPLYPPLSADELWTAYTEAAAR